jgi:hypothetical protein
MIPSQYILHYEGYTVYQYNGLYTIYGSATLSYFSFTEAKKQIDEWVKTQELFENLKTSDAKTTNAD